MTSDNPEHIELQKGMWGRNHGHVPFSDTEARAGIVLGPTEIYAYMGDFEKAIANCEEVISAFPNTEVANTARERLPYYQSGESRSINSYERKMKLKEKRKNRRQAQ